MRFSLKTKFISAFGTLTIVLFLGLGFFLVDAKEKELSKDISDSAQGFARYSVDAILKDEVNFLESGQFLPFRRELSRLLSGSSEIKSLQILEFNGAILYDSKTEVTARYAGPDRVIGNEEDLDRAQSNKMSLRLEDGRVIYVVVNPDEHFSYVNFNEDPVAAPSSTDRIMNVMMPSNSSHAVLYEVSYDGMTQRLSAARRQIAGVAGFGLFVTLAMAYMFSVSITNPLEQLKAGVLKIGSGEFSARVPVRTRDEVGVLAETFNSMAETLEKSTQAMKYKERVQKELDLAAQIQIELLPKDKLILPGLDLTGGLIPASEIGGDAFDYIPMPDGRYLAYLGDVTGHGVPAGILSSVANALLYSMRAEPNLLILAERLNDVLRDKTVDRLFMTLALLIWDEKNSKLNYLSAGHPPAILYSDRARTAEEHRLKGIALGMVNNVSPLLEVKEIPLETNDVFVVYSDGIPEARNPAGEEYGLDRLKKLILSAAKDLYTAEAIKNAILSDVIDFIGGLEHRDDITVLVLKKK